jgi:hypothetical protein
MRRRQQQDAVLAPVSSWLPVPLLTDDATRRRILHLLEARILQGTGNRYEHLELLAVDASLLFAKDGSIDGVELSPNEVYLWRGRAYLATHNHPTSLPFTVGDVLAAAALEVQELNAFGPTLRYRLVRKLGSAWPKPESMLQSLAEIEAEVRAIVEPKLVDGTLAPGAALALHRHSRWTLFARRFSAIVDYLLEDR